MPLELEAVVRAVNVQLASPMAWFTCEQLEDWMDAHAVKVVDGAADFLDGVAVAILIPYEQRSLVVTVPELGSHPEMPRHHMTHYLASRGLDQPYKAACETGDGRKYQLMVYGPEDALEGERPRKGKRPPLYNWPPPTLLSENHPLHGQTFIGDSPREIAESLKEYHPEAIVFVQNGYFLEAFDGDAHACSEIFGWKVADHGKGGEFTGVPIRARRFRDKLRETAKPYIIVLQQQYPAPDGPVARQVHEAHGV